MTDIIQTDSMSPFFSREVAVEMNRSFYLAMLAARRNGTEQFRIGIVVDRTPMVPVHFERQVIFSGMSSSAALCAEEVSPGVARMISGRFGR